MAKKKEYVPPRNDKWDEEAAQEHRRIIGENEKTITKRYKRWWDSKKHRWKEGFSGH